MLDLLLDLHKAGVLSNVIILLYAWWIFAYFILAKDQRYKIPSYIWDVNNSVWIYEICFPSINTNMEQMNKI